MAKWIMRLTNLNVKYIAYVFKCGQSSLLCRFVFEEILDSLQNAFAAYDHLILHVNSKSYRNRTKDNIL